MTRVEHSLAATIAIEKDLAVWDFKNISSLTGIATGTLHNWYSNGVLPFKSTRLGRRRVVRLDELVEWLDNGMPHYSS